MEKLKFKKHWGMTSVLLNSTATPFVISTSFLVTEHFILLFKLFKSENICNFVQIGGIVIFNNLYDVFFFFFALQNV